MEPCLHILSHVVQSNGQPRGHAVGARRPLQHRRRLLTAPKEQEAPWWHCGFLGREGWYLDPNFCEMLAFASLLVKQRSWGSRKSLKPGFRWDLPKHPQPLPPPSPPLPGLRLVPTASPHSDPMHFQHSRSQFNTPERNTLVRSISACPDLSKPCYALAQLGKAQLLNQPCLFPSRSAINSTPCSAQARAVARLL